jgi:hypothetical protein
MNSGVGLPTPLCETNLVWQTISITAETLHQVAPNMRKTVNAVDFSNT